MVVHCVAAPLLMCRDALRHFFIFGFGRGDVKPPRA